MIAKAETIRRAIKAAQEELARLNWLKDRRDVEPETREQYKERISEQTAHIRQLRKVLEFVEGEKF